MKKETKKTFSCYAVNVEGINYDNNDIFNKTKLNVSSKCQRKNKQLHLIQI